MPELIALSVFLAVTASAYTLVARPQSSIKRRLSNFKEMSTADEVEREPGFVERVARPAALATLDFAKRILPAGQLERLQWRLTQAGDPCTVPALLGIWLAAAALLPLSYFTLVRMRGAGFGTMELVLLLVLTLLGAFGPHLWLSNKKKRRQSAILKSMPDAIDLLTTSVEAGLGIDAAMAQVGEKVKGPIAKEFRRVLREMTMGAPRREALRDMSDRVDLPDMVQFVNAVVQAEQMGVSLAQVIRVQADQMRTRRRQRAEKQAHKAPIKMVFPLVFFIFPAIFVVILGPAAMNLKEALGGG